jgi:hypothetical protein
MGKLKGKVVTAGDKGMLRYKNEAGERVEIPFTQQYQKELGIEANGTVMFDLITVDGKSMGVAVEAVDKGDISSIDGRKGIIIEKDSGRSYAFEQDYLTESKITVNSPVKFKFVISNGALVATCVSLCAD